MWATCKKGILLKKEKSCFVQEMNICHEAHPYQSLICCQLLKENCMVKSKIGIQMIAKGSGKIAALNVTANCIVLIKFLILRFYNRTAIKYHDTMP